jgi:hypothetical protein
MVQGPSAMTPKTNQTTKYLLAGPPRTKKELNMGIILLTPYRSWIWIIAVPHTSYGVNGPPAFVGWRERGCQTAQRGLVLQQQEGRYAGQDQYLACAEHADRSGVHITLCLKCSPTSDLLLVASDVDVRAPGRGRSGKVECPHYRQAQIDSRICRRRG